MTLKECVMAAAQTAGLKAAHGFDAFDFTVCAQGETVVFVTECDSEMRDEYLSLDGIVYKTVKQRVKLSVFVPVGCCTARQDAAHEALTAISALFGDLSLDGSFSSLQLSVSEARSSAAHSGVMREGYISALCTLADSNAEEA